MRRLLTSIAVPAVVVAIALPASGLSGRLGLGELASSASGPSGAATRAAVSNGSELLAQPDGVAQPDDRHELQLVCRDHDRGDQPAIECAWSRARRDDFSAYHLRRRLASDPDDKAVVIFTTSDRDRTSFVDEAISHDVAYVYWVEATSEDGTVIARSRAVSAVDPSDQARHSRLACRDEGRGEEPDDREVKTAPSSDAETIMCRWSRWEGNTFGGYRLLRKAAGDSDDHAVVVFETNDRDTTSYVDGTAAPRAVYDYVLDVLDQHGARIDRSNTARAGGDEGEAERMKLACGDPDPTTEEPRPVTRPDAAEQEVIACRWSRASRDDFGSYRLLRWTAGPAAHSPTVVFETRDRDQTVFGDRSVTEGTAYVYLVQALDPSGAVIGSSNPARAGGEEPRPPDASERPDRGGGPPPSGEPSSTGAPPKGRPSPDGGPSQGNHDEHGGTATRRR